jgi:hypothetical protein
MAACNGNDDADSDETPTDPIQTLPAGNQPSLKTGTFLDSAVEGLRYQSGAANGVTTATGEFIYENGKTVRFYVGDILIGETAGTTVVMPNDFAQTKNIADDASVNIARFLQTIDDNRDPSDGIKITETVTALARNRILDFTQSTADFENDPHVQSAVAELTAATVAGASNLIPKSDALAHLSETMHALQGVEIDWSTYYAFDNDKQWNYDVVDLDSSQLITSMYRFVKAGTLDGRSVWIEGWSPDWMANAFSYWAIESSGVAMLGWNVGSVDTLLDKPMRVGRKIIFGQPLYSVVDFTQSAVQVTRTYEKEAVTVPYGAFSDCIKETLEVTDTSDATITWYCHGVGQAKQEVYSADDSPYVEVLTDVGTLPPDDSGAGGTAPSCETDPTDPGCTVEVGHLEIQSSVTTIISGGQDTATITATVLDANRAPLKDVQVIFTATAGMLSASTAFTDSSGQATVQFSSSASEPDNGVVHVTATVTGVATATIPVTIIGTTLTIAAAQTTLVIPAGGSSVSQVVSIVAKDGTEHTIYDAPITLTVAGNSEGTVPAPAGTVLSSSAVRTDTQGVAEVTLTVANTGMVYLKASGLGASAVQDFAVQRVIAAR